MRRVHTPNLTNSISRMTRTSPVIRSKSNSREIQWSPTPERDDCLVRTGITVSLSLSLLLIFFIYFYIFTSISILKFILHGSLVTTVIFSWKIIQPEESVPNYRLYDPASYYCCTPVKRELYVLFYFHIKHRCSLFDIECIIKKQKR